MEMALLDWHHSGGCSALRCRAVAHYNSALHKVMLVSISEVLHEKSVESVLC